MNTKAPCKIREWKDQPEVLEFGTHKARFNFSGSRSGQVIEYEGMYYISIGNLFGSQTVRVPNSDEALAVIDWADKCNYERRAGKSPPAASDVKTKHPTWEFLIDGEWV